MQRRRNAQDLADLWSNPVVHQASAKRYSDHAEAANALAGFSSQHSLLKPEIARRVALMHGTTKARWERHARAFPSFSVAGLQGLVGEQERGRRRASLRSEEPSFGKVI
jgi:hypothetical protein